MKSFLSFKVLKYLGFLTQLGITIIASIFVGVIVGYYLDRVFHSGFIMTIIFLIFGVIAGFLNVYRMINNMEGKKKG